MTPIRGPHNESYDEYFYKWSEEQQELCKDLQAELNNEKREEELQHLIEKVRQHYQEYYSAKGGAAKQDVLKMMQPSWRTPLENAFLWIGGWRPTMAFQLAYAQAGLQIEAELAEFLSGLDTPSMASLSSKQLSQISDLQVKTHKLEDELGHQQALVQQSLVDQPLLTLAQADQAGEVSDHSDTLSDAMDEKVKSLEELMSWADELRIETLEEFLKILTTVQAAQYLSAAGQLFAAMRKLGVKKEQESSLVNGQSQNGRSP
ncbi:unnamed protein product [Calypogeia fissa]